MLIAIFVLRSEASKDPKIVSQNLVSIMDFTPGSARIVNIPGELQNRILSHLDIISQISLKLTSIYFDNLIAKLSLETLLDAEESEFAQSRDLYGCYDCLRLRTSHRFADNQLRKKRRRFGAESFKRFCIDCGLEVRQGRLPTVRYVRGNQIDIQGVSHVICIKCGSFALRGNEKDYEATCVSCWRPFQEARRRAQESRMREERLKSRAERAQRRERRRRVFGPASEDSCSPSPTPSEKFIEEQMDMIQAEADMHMNSPGPGSD
ncbi:uncharacterized protein PpBr36_11042 [Pyricularia pennisetigena]|uniref:uncharacterized protein n=1 Tax=Pyricularia pennisetigena TaxID=1578925 RepID=UPI00115011B6|nr:uncharacterized protein PpBr36_11042 [Pyricularia pennisetigena]TLS20743.1 hypothetical protein PpBr36_11042 [Pyricularia pennisetigena]